MVLIFGTLIPDARARDEVCVYDKKDYKGEEFCTSRDIPNLGDYGWNDKISSISVNGDADLILYVNSDYKGKSIEYSGDVSRIRGGLDGVIGLSRHYPAPPGIVGSKQNGDTNNR